MAAQIDEAIKDKLCRWAASNDATFSLWLFGSRAKGTARPESDYDIAIEVMPKKGDHDWSFGDYVFLYEEWKKEIKAIVQGEASLVAFRDDLERRFDPRENGIKLWSRI